MIFPLINHDIRLNSDKTKHIDPSSCVVGLPAFRGAKKETHNSVARMMAIFELMLFVVKRALIKLIVLYCTPHLFHVAFQ